MTSPIAVLAITDFGTNWGKGLGSHQWAERHQFWQVNPLFHFWGDLRVGDHWKLKLVLFEREEARDQTYQRDSGRR